MDTQTIRDDIDSRLRSFGLEVTDTAQWQIWVSIYGMRLMSAPETHAGYSASVTLRLRAEQPVTYPSGGQGIGWVVLWVRSQTGSAPPSPDACHNMVAQRVQHLVDAFLSDWRAANPRP